jgi:hypothetical protein
MQPAKDLESQRIVADSRDEVYPAAKSMSVVGEVGGRTAQLLPGWQQVPEDLARSQYFETLPAT